MLPERERDEGRRRSKAGDHSLQFAHELLPAVGCALVVRFLLGFEARLFHAPCTPALVGVSVNVTTVSRPIDDHLYASR